MKKVILISSFFLFSFFTWSQELTTFVLVRHAEKAKDGTNDPRLTEEGLARASDLAALLEKQDISALYSTPYKRTQETLIPIAKATDMAIANYHPHSDEKWLETLVTKHTGGTVVISGHSNTIPNLSNMLLGEELFSQFDDSDYANLIIIVVTEVGNGKLVRLRF